MKCYWLEEWLDKYQPVMAVYHPSDNMDYCTTRGARDSAVDNVVDNVGMLAILFCGVFLTSHRF